VRANTDASSEIGISVKISNIVTGNIFIGCWEKESVTAKNPLYTLMEKRLQRKG
jgi:hypothetical protein